MSYGADKQQVEKRDDRPKNRRIEDRIVQIGIATGMAVGMVALYFLSRVDYLLFHSLTEFFGIVIAFVIFVIAWNSRKFTDNGYFLFIGVAYLFVGVLELVHGMAYQGMGVFPGASGNLSSQLWIAGRYVESVSLLAAPLFIHRKPRLDIVFAVYSLVTALLFGSIFIWGNFPATFVEEAGLTPFKVVSEYVVCLILFCSIGLLVRNRREFSSDIFNLMVTAIAVGIATEMAFTLYTDIYGIATVAGHLLKVVSFYLIYKALIEIGLSRPYDLLFRNLKQSETYLAMHASELADANRRLVQEAAERKRMEEEVRSVARFPSENPYPVLRIGKDGTIMYSNPACRSLMGGEKCSVGNLAPES